MSEDDFVAMAQRYRAEHEATHGEPEQCGGPCIVLGLAADDIEPEYDADGDPIRPDPRSEDWYDGYGEGQRDAIAAIDAALAPRPEPTVIRCICGEIESNRSHHDERLSSWHPFAGEVAPHPDPES